MQNKRNTNKIFFIQYTYTCINFILYKIIKVNKGAAQEVNPKYFKYPKACVRMN